MLELIRRERHSIPTAYQDPLYKCSKGKAKWIVIETHLEIWKHKTVTYKAFADPWKIEREERLLQGISVPFPLKRVNDEDPKIFFEYCIKWLIKHRLNIYSFSDCNLYFDLVVKCRNISFTYVSGVSGFTWLYHEWRCYIANFDQNYFADVNRIHVGWDGRQGVYSS
jgi:hypothetical protein